MRASVSFAVSDTTLMKVQLVNWCNHFAKCMVLDSNHWDGNKNELIAAVGSLDEIVPTGNFFEELKKFHSAKKDWLFGHLSYDLSDKMDGMRPAARKNGTEKFAGVGFPDMHFFQPEYVFILRENNLEIHYLEERSTAKEMDNIFLEISFMQEAENNTQNKNIIACRTSKAEYTDAVNRIKDHIRMGDIYEMNYCMEFFSEDAEINPAAVFLKLNEISRAPFSAFYRLDDKCLMCASPERFLKKSGNKIISQPIKGTAKRGASVPEDLEIKRDLSQNEKEKSENVMIVDLVRNDLSRSCTDVTVDELFGIYTFRQWHQMVSTISGELRRGIHFTDAIKNAFPMGSMTGAPKIRAMELIAQYEKTKRGLYSGTVGYITPEGDFDLNVVIRSILYNQTSNYLSFQAGSAITANSIAEKEYEECLLKANGMFEALNISEDLRENRSLHDSEGFRKKENTDA